MDNALQQLMNEYDNSDHESDYGSHQQDDVESNKSSSSSTDRVIKIPSKTHIKKRGREVDPFLDAFSQSTPLNWEGLVDDEGTVLPVNQNQVVARLVAQNREIYSKLESMKSALLASLTKSSTTGISLVDYTFEQEVVDELELHPRDHSHIADDAFAEQMKAIPQVKLQAVTTSCEDPALIENLRGIAKIKFSEIIPKQERQWSNQLRISAYLYDMLLKVRRSDQYQETLAHCPDLEDIYKMALFSFLSATTMRRKLANERVRILGEAAGPQFLNALKDRDETKDMQHRELLNDDDTKAIANALKRQKVIKKAAPEKKHKYHGNNSNRNNNNRVFGRGRGRGRSFPQYTSTGRSNNQDHSHQYHQHRKWVRDPTQQPNRQAQQSPAKFAARGRGRSNFPQQQQHTSA
jgi:hypothetical protein